MLSDGILSIKSGDYSKPQNIPVERGFSACKAPVYPLVFAPFVTEVNALIGCKQELL